jgi:hypothetical protein
VARDKKRRKKAMNEHASREEIERWVAEEMRRMAKLPDAEVLAMADMMMSPEDDSRMSVLLDKNRESQLQPGEKEELDELMRVYQDGMLTKSSGWAEAVRRKLRESPFESRQ